MVYSDQDRGKGQLNHKIPMNHQRLRVIYWLNITITCNHNSCNTHIHYNLLTFCLFVFIAKTNQSLQAHVCALKVKGQVTNLSNPPNQNSRPSTSKMVPIKKRARSYIFFIQPSPPFIFTFLQMKEQFLVWTFLK